MRMKIVCSLSLNIIDMNEMEVRRTYEVDTFWKVFSAKETDPVALVHMNVTTNW